MFAVPQGSILGPLVLNILMCDLLITLEIEFAGYADHNTPFVSEATPENVVSFLENCSESCSTSLFEYVANTK